MTCARYENDLALYVERDLPSPDVPAVEAHLRECAECRRFLDDLRASQSLVHGLAASSIDEEGLADLRGRVIAAALSPVASRARWESAAVWASAAVVVVGISGSVWMARGGRESHAPRVVQGVSATTASSRPQRLTMHESTDRARETVSLDVNRPRIRRAPPSRPARVPVLSADDADQLARAVVAVSQISSAHDRPADPDPAPEVETAPLMRLASTDPNVVLYWQLDPNGGD